MNCVRFVSVSSCRRKWTEGGLPWSPLSLYLYIAMQEMIKASGESFPLILACITDRVTYSAGEVIGDASAYNIDADSTDDHWSSFRVSAQDVHTNYLHAFPCNDGYLIDTGHAKRSSACR
jgi:hypothetical protein